MGMLPCFSNFLYRSPSHGVLLFLTALMESIVSCFLLAAGFWLTFVQIACDKIAYRILPQRWSIRVARTKTNEEPCHVFQREFYWVSKVLSTIRHVSDAYGIPSTIDSCEMWKESTRASCQNGRFRGCFLFAVERDNQGQRIGLVQLVKKLLFALYIDWI